MQIFLEVTSHLCKNSMAWIKQNQCHLTKHLLRYVVKSYFHVFDFQTELLDFECNSIIKANLSQQR